MSLEINGATIFTCNPGYNVSGSSASVCLPTGTWSTSPPTCQRVLCPDLSALANGAISAGNNEVFTVRRFTCNAGFNLVGNPATVCLQTGSWSDGTPHCIEKPTTCPKLLAPANGFIDNGSLDVGSAREYSCAAGYMTEDLLQTACLKNGRWSQPVPACYRGPTTGAQTTTCSTSSNVIAGAIGFFIGLLIPGSFVLVHLFRSRRGSKRITMTDNIGQPPTIFRNQLTKSQAYGMDLTTIEPTQEPEYEAVEQT
ncbi:P-selectin-like [Sycon ciliatum]|uniref:P-selectin-like n=1 Tax=Sycon ciliatum TaxID=27933 RepID=UPI0031F64E8B